MIDHQHGRRPAVLNLDQQWIAGIWLSAHALKDMAARRCKVAFLSAYRAIHLAFAKIDFPGFQRVGYGAVAQAQLVEQRSQFAYAQRRVRMCDAVGPDAKCMPAREASIAMDDNAEICAVAKGLRNLLMQPEVRSLTCARRTAFG